MSRVSISLPVYSTPLAKVREMTSWADDAGFEAVFQLEIVQNPFVTLAAAAGVTSRIKLGTASAVAFGRSPWITANAAADLDELSGGRAVLGLAPGGEWHLTGMHNTDLAHVVPRMREYVHCVRTCWDSVGSGTPATFEGEHYRLRLDEGLHRTLVRPRIPIYLSAMSPRMIELAGEVGDGLLGHLYSARYLRDLVVPHLVTGAKRAGREPDSVERCVYLICAVSDDRAQALRWARIQVGFYVFLPSADPVVRWHGLEKEQAAVREALHAEGPAALERVTDDKLVQAFSLAGTPDDVRRQLRDYQDLVTQPLLHVPYFAPITPEESEAAFRNVLDGFGN